jgi:hypothetical protein
MFSPHLEFQQFLVADRVERAQREAELARLAATAHAARVAARHAARHAARRAAGGAAARQAVDTRRAEPNGWRLHVGQRLVRLGALVAGAPLAALPQTMSTANGANGANGVSSVSGGLRANGGGIRS